jgi:hypothetical protein
MIYTTTAERGTSFQGAEISKWLFHKDKKYTLVILMCLCKKDVADPC